MKSSTHFPRVAYDQTMDQRAREKRTLQLLRDGRVRLRIERKKKSILAKSNEQRQVDS